jgi:spermidine/putrescine transport system substrate-binding protein
MRWLVVSIVLGFCADYGSAASRLNLFIWSEYIDPAVVAAFEKRLDCRVTLDFYEDEASMMAKLQGGGAAQYDVIVPPDHSVPALIKLKLIAPLASEKIPNMRNIEERFANPWYDPGNRFTVPYQWGTVGIYMRKLAGKPIEQTWGLLFDAKLQPGEFVLIDSMRDALGSALRYKGHSINSVSPAELAEARDILISAKKRARGFEGAVGGKNKVLSKEVTAAIAFSGDAVRGMKEDTNTVYFIPKEGSQIWIDNLAICARAPHREMAEKFLNFILEPEIGAKLADFNQYATPNKAAKPFVNPENLKNPAIYPDAETTSRLEFLHDLGKSTRLYDEVWTQVKAR